MNKKNVISGILIIFIVMLMVGAAQLFHEKEIIFPEITALAVGTLIAPHFSWRVSFTRMILLIGICAAGGVLIVRYMPLPLWGQITLAFCLCQGIYLSSRTNFAPMISAMVLPVLLGTISWIYPISAILLTALIVAIRWILEQTGLYSAEKFVPLERPDSRQFLDAAVRILCVLILTIVALTVNARFCIAPPLLVAFTEFSNRECKARNHPLKTVLLINACVLAGTLCRMLFSMRLGMPLFFAAGCSTVLMLVLLHGTGMYLPPAGAMTILAMLIPEKTVFLYPLQALIGTLVLMGLSMVFFQKQKKEEKESVPI